jgi:ribosome-associated toxin RatA of RatAB toxin-antitoxin module
MTAAPDKPKVPKALSKRAQALIELIRFEIEHYREFLPAYDVARVEEERRQLAEAAASKWLL